ncbi:FAD-linked oxidoreductase [Aspergillus novofumigatus IBT 16806]|uniref:Putative FAD-dependent oxidase n=1 Tax=Aspergillus novofumigatus (strain IBT 16806) TaxID=1392255 RepID=A0A2I1CC25_ASPN1|nr:putative FAD-dependent oxidase [Aspergillus novofumigatus IBT 16806]PKX95151.1 putative FAD-dependent oxidase [Aspergillus novofumigatus IBT 16806]
MRRATLVPLAIWVAGAAAAAPASLPQVPSCDISLANIGLSQDSLIFFPNSSGWESETIRWTEYMAPTYSVSVRPAHVSDVQALVRFATRCNIPFLASSGQHGFDTELAELQNGMEIDLSAFRNVSVDAEKNTLTVGGGVRFMDVFDPVFNAGKEIRTSQTDHQVGTGSGACVGMISPTLGGGVGRLSGTHGIISDQLLSVQMVTANGSLVTASKKKNPNLFWGLRGAGGNFGIVVEAVYQVTDLTSENVVNLDYAFSTNDTGAIIDYLASFGSNMPPKLSFIIAALYNEKLFGGFAVIVSGLYTGPQSEAEQLLAPLLQNATPIKQNVSVVPENKLVYAATFGSQGNSTIACSGKGVNRSIFGGPSTQLVTTNTDLRGSVFFIEHFSNYQVQKIPDHTSAYPWRDITAHLLFNYAWNDPANQQLMLYSAKNLPRLRALKKQWDPENVFRFHHPISMS